MKLILRRSMHLNRNYDNGAPGEISLMVIYRSSSDGLLKQLVNDVCVHPNQGELISCDQAGRIKQWDLSENICSHELVSLFAKHYIMPPLYCVPDTSWRHSHSVGHTCL